MKDKIARLCDDLVHEQSEEQILNLMNRIEHEYRKARTENDRAVRILAEYIEENGPIVNHEGGYVWKVKKTFTEKFCGTKEDMLEALFEESGGDMLVVSECLSSSAFLPGACSKHFGKDFRVRNFYRKWGEPYARKEPIRDTEKADAKLLAHSLEEYMWE